MLRTSCVIQGMNDPAPVFKQALDGTYDIAYYYFDTYTPDTMEAARYTTYTTACSYWAHNPRQTEFVSHGTYWVGSPYYTPGLCFESGGALNPDYLAWYVPSGSMPLTDTVFLGSCYSLMNYEADRPATVSFGKTFIKHAGADYVIGSPVQQHALNLILFTAYFWHFRLVYGYPAIQAFNAAKSSTIAFLLLAGTAWPVSWPLALLWLNWGLQIPLPALVANILLITLCLFSITAFIVALWALSVIIVDTNYYG